MSHKSSKKMMNIKYSSYLSEIVDLNESFDKGIMRIAYTGLNRNNSFISKETFEKCLKTLAYVPVVANYSIEENKIGGHDSEYVEDENGELKEYVLTMPLGLVPENFHWHWEEVQEQDGKIHEYLCAEVLLWKRQPVYEHIKKKGITDQSMEIAVHEGEFTNGYYHITDFTFVALCLLEDVEPCFESASLHTYSSTDFKAQYTQMFEEFKLLFANQPSQNDVDNNTKFNEKEDDRLNKKLELIKSYGLDADELDFNYEDYDLDELKAKLDEYMATQTASDNQSDTADENKNEYALASQLTEALHEAISAEKIETEYGVYSRYFIVDYDTEVNEVYAYDREDYKLYGFTYSVSGDVVTIDFDSKKRKKFAIVDFIEGDVQEFNLEEYTKEMLDSAIKLTTKNLEEKFATEKATLEEKVAEFERINEEYKALQEFKAEHDKAQKEAIFKSERYSVLADSDAFKALQKDVDKYSVDEIEKECKVLYAEYVMSMEKFSVNSELNSNRIVLPTSKEEKKPYGGYFEKYVNSKN